MGYPLHVAIQLGRLHCITTILRLMPLLNAPNSDGVKPILIASSELSVKHEIINFLIDAGADVNITHFGRTPLHYVAMLGVLALVPPRLLELSTSVDLLDEQGKTPLFLAAEYSKEDNVVMLLGEGADPTIPLGGQSGRGIFPLITAVEHGHLKVLAEMTPHDHGCKAVEKALQRRQYNCLVT